MSRPLKVAAKVLALVSLVFVASLPRGTVSRAEIHLEPGERAVVFGVGSAGLVVRSGPGRWFPILSVIPQDTVVTVVEGPTWSGNTPWYLISGLGSEVGQGWSAGNYLQPETVEDPEATDGSGRNLEVSSRGGSRGSSFVAMVTGYCIQGRTATGRSTEWGIVAVDPSVVPLGSRIQIAGFDEPFVAMDTGGDVKGNWIDIWFPTCADASQFGTQARRVTIIQ